MQLRIIRSQNADKGFFGGHKGVTFALRYKLDVAEEDVELVNYYQVGSAIVHEYVSHIFHDGERFTTPIRVNELIGGSSLHLKDFSEIINAENALVTGAQTLKGLLAQMRKFGGEEVIEI